MQELAGTRKCRYVAPRGFQIGKFANFSKQVLTATRATKVSNFDRSPTLPAFIHSVSAMRADYNTYIVILVLCLCHSSTASRVKDPRIAAADSNVAKVPVGLFVMSKCP